MKTEIMSNLFITVSPMPMQWEKVYKHLLNKHDELEIISFLILFSFIVTFNATFSKKEGFYHFLFSVSRWTMTSREYQSCRSGSWEIVWFLLTK